MVEEVVATLRAAHEALRASISEPPAPAAEPLSSGGTGDAVETAVDADRLRALNDELLRVPDGFTVNPKLARQLERRRQTIEEGGIDWGQAEALAFASLLEDGIPIRLSGQDTERGTFSHRHLVLHDPHTGEKLAPIQRLSGASASFEVYNSPLSEYAALGFEYGYSVSAPEALVLWEAQFGDFVNGAQIVVDQFVVAGRSKWKQTSRLTLLLPHGYEGNGPEHSSARLERFLQLGAQDNIRVANCTTAAQYFHLLRRQALDAVARPLVLMTPKGLLRLRQASSALDELAAGRFEAVLDDAGADREAVERLVLCSGKVYYDIVGHDRRDSARAVAVARVEQLYPFPADALGRTLGAYPQPARGRVGPGGATEHGPVALDPPPARGGRPLDVGGTPPVRRAHVEGEPERGLPDRAPARAGSHRPPRAGRGVDAACRPASACGSAGGRAWSRRPRRLRRHEGRGPGRDRRPCGAARGSGASTRGRAGTRARRGFSRCAACPNPSTRASGCDRGGARPLRGPRSGARLHCGVVHDGLSSAA